MLRIKRSVAAAFSQQHFTTAVIDAAVVSAAAAPAAGEAGKRKREGEDSMAALEAAVAEPLQPGTRVKGFVSAGVIQQNTQGEGGAGGGGAAAAANPDEIALDEDDGEGAGGGEEGEGGEEGVELQQQAVPDAVFGSLAKKQRTDGS